MDISVLRTFLSLAETGSFSRTAERLHLTQPAVSKRIAALEFSLGTSLFDRIGKKVQLTEAGRALVPGSERIVAEMEETQRILSNLEAHTHGTLSMAASHHVGLHRLPAVLRRYSDDYPDVRLDIRFLDSDRAFPLLLRGELELAIVTLPDADIPQLEQVVLWSDPMRCVVSNDHPLSRHHRLSPRQLLAYRAIMPTEGTHTRELVEAALGRDAGDSTVLESSYLETIKAMVQAGLGWSVLPESMIDDSLVSLPVRRLGFDRHLGVVMHRERTLSSAANRMLQTLGIERSIPTRR